ncbi:ATP13A3 [Symbiodinium sp. CCMP2456]|nr:ATP13A3 [Symbiodinium sp. CCMP2456]
MRSWMVLLGMGYVFMLWGCWMSYVIFANLWFPPGAEFWLHTFQSWDGLMLPWAVCFVLEHFFLAVLLVFWDAVHSHAMLPVPRMCAATHLLVQECPKVEMGVDELRKSLLVVFGEYLHRVRMREMLPVLQSESGHRYAEYTCVRYVYSEACDAFVLANLCKPEAGEMHRRLRSGGLSEAEAAASQESCGPNSIHVPVPSRLEALACEFSHFTYVFNSIAIWTYVAYTTWNIGLLWLFMTLGSGTYRALGITRPSKKRVSDMARMQKSCVVLREGKFRQLDVSEIVQGDIVQVKGGKDAELPCDGMLISGSLIVNESMLTGEPMPIAKVPVEDVDHYQVHPKSNKAFAGTRIIESRGETEHGGFALLYCTEVGARTTRGELVRMVLFPSSVKFKYNDQLPTVYALMFAKATVLVMLHLFAAHEGSPVVTFLNVTCAIAGTVSPMLPVSLVMGQSVSAKRLTAARGYQIKCLQPGRIPIAGKISTMVFDKTGTITKSTMDLVSVQATQKLDETAHFQPLLWIDGEPESGDVDRPRELPNLLQCAMAVCHTVKQLDDGSLVGNELECAMLRKTNCRITQNAIILPDEEVEIVRDMQFDHQSMTSGVVVRRSRGQLEVFVKGSPDKIQAVACPSSLPADYGATISAHAKANYYALSICHRSLPEKSNSEVGEMSRSELEQNVQFCGLLLFRNEMKREAPQAIQQLKEGDIRSVICTGDSELTGIAIGRQCGIVSGDCLLATVQDHKLVWQDPEEMDMEGLVVGMAGDGGNDCGGLRAAHVGIALSGAEASLVAPFSTGRLEEGSQDDSNGQISLLTIPDLIREGRACLATNLATFAYFIVQAFSLSGLMTTVHVAHNVTIGEWVWLMKDIGFGMIMVFFMTQSKALSCLAKVRPTATLLGARTLLTIASQVLLNWLFFGCAFCVLKAEAWYDPLDPINDISVLPHLWMLKGDNYDGAVCAVCVFVALANTSYVNTYGGNFRRSILQNWGICAASSLACSSLPLLDDISVGGVGECFLGPQVKYWQNHASYLPQAGDSPWLPSPDNGCLPPTATLEHLPLDHLNISTGKGFKVGACIGPNNCS